MSEPQYREWVGKIVDAYRAVYTDLPHSYPGPIYENAMIKILHSQNMKCRPRPKYEIRYKEQPIGVQELAILTTEKIAVNLQVVPRLKRVHMAETYSYMRVTQSSVGILLNFGSTKPEFMRLAWDTSDASKEAAQPPGAEMAENQPYHQLTAAVLDATVEVHRTLGPGFAQPIYGNACHHELWMRRIPATAYSQLPLFFQEAPIGHFEYNHFIVNKQIALFPIAVNEIDSFNIDSLKSWMKRGKIGLSVLVNFLDTRIRPVFIRPRSQIDGDQES